ncbi:Crp/Fnr family transcriptional regulator [Pectinatus frisingensis]|jgi:CRP/FNR family cyclic AMP-dependent transcriptional regulator|uniref:Crp/Fnr family transcriptional regulator n=1 Tax=Pectinatus frisingensis TaxID=865 RepID=UPI0018C7EFAB|nr:Crp/Fnr family transcriptional regulator [Pectinatus frisingensis]
MQQLYKLIDAIPESIQGKLIKRNISAGETILYKGEDVQHVYILIKGIVSVSNEFKNGQRYTFAQFGAPSFIGEVESLAEQPIYAATVQAVTPCTTLSMSTSTFWHWLESDTSFSLLMAQLVATKMYPSSNNNGTIKFMSGKQKLLHYLIDQYLPYDKNYFTLTIKKYPISL